MAVYSRLIMGEICEASILPAMLDVQTAQKGDTFILKICSYGGDTGPAYALIDLMRESPAKIITIALGAIISAALDIFVAGDWRVVYPSTIGMAHNASSAPGTRQSASSMKRELELDDARGYALYREKTIYKTDEELRRVLFKPRKDTWLTPEEMIGHGLADEIARPEPKPFILLPLKQ